MGQKKHEINFLAMGMQSKILVISTTPFASTKGSSLRVHAIVSKLASKAIVDMVAYPSGEDPQIKNLSLFRVMSFIRPKLGVGKISPTRLLLDVGVFIKSLKLSLTREYQIIHCEDFEAALMGRILKIFKPGRYYVYDLHNSIVDNLELSGAPVFLVNLSRKLERWVMDGFDKIIINWAFYRDHHIIKEKEHFLYYDHTSTETAPLALPTKKPYLAYSGNFKRYQGVEEFLETFAAVKTKFDIILVGEPTTNLKATIERLGLSQRVHLMGRLPIEQSNHVLKGAVVCLIPRTEGIQPGLKSIHHLMLGKVSLGRDLPANTESLKHMYNAILYKDDLQEILGQLDKGELDLEALTEGIEESQKEVKKYWSDTYFNQNYFKGLKNGN